MKPAAYLLAPFLPPAIQRRAFKSAHSSRPGDHLVVEDPDKPTTWHLPVKRSGKPDHRLMGAAWAALHGGYRGNKYAGPDKAGAIRKLKKLYESEGLDLPSEKSLAAQLTSGYDALKTLTAVKALSDRRVGAYCVLWGGPAQKDLTGEYFDRRTQELKAIFDGVGRLPYLYHHSLDPILKTAVIGVVDVLEPDEVGLWYEAQLKLSDDYGDAIRKLICESKLLSSTQTFPVARKVAPDGRIERWPIVEITATPTPAEPRLLPVAELKAAYSEIGVSCNDFECAVVRALNPSTLYPLVERERVALLSL